MEFSDDSTEIRVPVAYVSRMFLGKLFGHILIDLLA
jgi:hypothetical protein